MTPQEILAKAAEVMAERGKARGTYECRDDDDYSGPKGSVCAYGAMTLAVTEGRTADYGLLLQGGYRMKGRVNQAAELLARHIGDEGSYVADFLKVTHFSDNSSGEDVILAMKKAAHE